MNKFNGKFGCIMCMQQGENLIHNGRGNNFKYTFKPNEMFIRTEQRYKQQVQESINRNDIFEGIKGSTYLSNWLRLPTGTVIDYMHASLLGVTKHLLNIWLSIENSKEDYYLRNKLPNIDKILLKVKYPIEFSRMQRSISEHIQFFKASEFRNFLMYVSLPIMRYFLPHVQYIHFVHYIVFMRLLCDKYCSNTDITAAYSIIEKFIEQFETLYGKKNMTFNLHSHLHLPQQVQR